MTLTDLLALFLRKGDEEKTTSALLPSPADLAHRKESDVRAELRDDQKALDDLKKHIAAHPTSPSIHRDQKRIKALETRLAGVSAVAATAAPSSTTTAVPTHANPIVEKDAAHISDLSRRVDQLGEQDAAAQHKPRSPSLLLPSRPETPTDSTHLSPRRASPISPMVAIAHASPHVARPTFIDEL